MLLARQPPFILDCFRDHRLIAGFVIHMFRDSARVTLDPTGVDRVIVPKNFTIVGELTAAPPGTLLLPNPQTVDVPL